MEIWFLTLVVLVLILSTIFWRKILVILSFIVHLPIFVELFFVVIYAKVVSKINVHFLKKRRYTIWLKRQTSAEKKLSFLSQELLDSFKEFVLGEKSNMIVLQKVGDKVPYVLEDERDLPESEQTTFYFQKIPRTEIAQARDNMAGISDEGRVEKLRSATVSYEITLEQLCDWDNIRDETGTEIPFDKSVKRELYDRLPIQVQDELEGEFGGGIQKREEEQVKEDGADAE